MARMSEPATSLEGAAARPLRSSFRWVVLALTCFIYMLVAADRANLGIALPSIKAEFELSNTAAGLFATLMFLAFTAAQIPSSYICQRFGPHKAMSVALILVSLASFLIGTSRSTHDIYAYRSFLGVVESCVSVCCMSALYNWFSRSERGTATGIFLGASKMGPVICPPLTVLILQAFGWRLIFQIFAIPVVLAAVVWYFLIRSKPEQSRHVSEAELEKIRSVLKPTTKADMPMAKLAPNVPQWVDTAIRYRNVVRIDKGADVYRSWNIIGITIATIFMVGIFNVFLAWIPSYLINGKHLALSAVGFVTATPFAGAVVGNVLGGWVSDKLLGMRRKPLMMLGALFSAAAICCLIYAPASTMMLGGFLLLTGFVVGLGYPHFSTYPMSLTSPAAYPIAYGVTNTGAGIGAGLFPLIAGVILDVSTWSALFAFLAVSSLMCFIVLTTIVEPKVEEH